jgi:hypothetical protein
LEAGGSGGGERNFQVLANVESEVHQDDVAGLERPLRDPSSRATPTMHS